MDQRDEMDNQLGSVKEKAYKDPLTNVRNKTAYMEMKSAMDPLIKEGIMNPFGVAVFDVNDLKKVNDTLGLNAGDKYLKDASHIICEQFKHSPVFRIGGDEFVAIVEGEELEHADDLEKTFEDLITQNKENGGIVIASGMDVYKAGTDNSYDDVFNRADEKMHIRKKALKGSEAIR
jgi:diguanylate cyclase (GGDEF)-like protein